MARICLVTPGQLSTNPRLVKEAQALSGAGHAVRIVATRYLDWAIAADEGFSGESWGRPRAVPFGPLADPVTRLRQRGVRTMAEAAVKLGVERAAAIAVHDAAGDLIAAAASEPADLYIAHYDAALPAAAVAARRHHGRYAFDAEDFHPGDLPASEENAAANRLISLVERQYLPGCAYVSAASPGIARAYAEAYGIAEPKVILNVFSAREAPVQPGPAGVMRPGPSIYWFSQTIGPNRGLEWAVRAIAVAAARPHLYLRGVTASGFRKVLEALAAEVGVSDRLHFLAPIPPNDLIAQMAQFDVSFIGETGHTSNRQIALVNKLFSSLTAGVPIIASDIPAHLQMVEGCEAAMTIFRRGHLDDLARKMDDWLLHPAKLAEARQSAWRLGQERFNWEIEQVKLLGLVNGALAGQAT